MERFPDESKSAEIAAPKRYIKRIEGDGLVLYVSVANKYSDDMLPRDFIQLHQANVWDSIAVDEGEQNLARVEAILATAHSALKPGGILDFQGYVPSEESLDQIDEIARSLPFDKISSEVEAEHGEDIYFRMTWQKREKEKLRIKKSVALLLSTLMER